MLSAAHRILGSCLALLMAGGATTSAGATRSGSSRSGSAGGSPSGTTPPETALSTRKIGGLDYVSVADAATRLGLKLTWTDRGRKLALSGSGGRAELENDTRDITVNGLRVFLGDPIVDAGRQLYISRVDFERCLTPLFRPGLGVAARPPLKTIVLDPGHGGRDNGTSASEKTYALDVARRAKKLLESDGYRVVLTRDTDVFLDLSQRGAIANAQRAGLFASIHFNAVANDRQTSGVEVFTFAPQFQRSTNSWSPGAGDDTEKEAAAVNRHDHWSVVLAQAVQRRLVKDLPAFDRGRKLAHWGVLRNLACPGVLIECGFLTSDAEARKIASTDYRQKLATAVAAGIRDYARMANGPRAQSSTASARPGHVPRSRQ